eukprot:1194331-Prorocentrum_minimum.AAC.7
MGPFRFDLDDTTGICSLPSCDWLPLRAYALYPHATGSRYGRMLSTLMRLAPATGMCSLPSCDWLLLRAYALYPHAIGSRYGHTVEAASTPLWAIGLTVNQCSERARNDQY